MTPPRCPHGNPPGTARDCACHDPATEEVSLLADLKAERDLHRAGIEEGYEIEEGVLCINAACGWLFPCSASRALDCAIAAIEESGAQLSIETEACHYAMLAAMEHAWRGEGEK